MKHLVKKLTASLAFLSITALTGSLTNASTMQEVEVSKPVKETLQLVLKVDKIIESKEMGHILVQNVRIESNLKVNNTNNLGVRFSAKTLNYVCFKLGYGKAEPEYSTLRGSYVTQTLQIGSSGRWEYLPTESPGALVMVVENLVCRK